MLRYAALDRMSTTKTLPTDSSWEVHLPVSRGSLPGGTPLRRTEPSGAVGAAIVLLGAYPAATRTRQTKVGDVRLTLPVEVEAESFAAGSRSGFELERHYLVPLALPRARTLLTDLWPYDLFYADAAEREVLGRAVRVVHLVHPHLFIKRNERWMRRHEGWVHEVGRRLIEHTLASIDERTDQ